MKNALLMALLSISLIAGVGCGTVTPEPVVSHEGTYDSSTPKQYDASKSGFIQFVRDSNKRVTGAIYTVGAMARYHALLEDYHIQLKEDVNVDVKPDDGISAVVDEYGNILALIDAEHLGYWLKMNRWHREQKPVDSMWMKMKEKVTQ